MKLSSWCWGMSDVDSITPADYINGLQQFGGDAMITEKRRRHQQRENPVRLRSEAEQ